MRRLKTNPLMHPKNPTVLCFAEFTRVAVRRGAYLYSCHNVGHLGFHLPQLSPRRLSRFQQPQRAPDAPFLCASLAFRFVKDNLLLFGHYLSASNRKRLTAVLTFLRRPLLG